MPGGSNGDDYSPFQASAGGDEAGEETEVFNENIDYRFRGSAETAQDCATPPSFPPKLFAPKIEFRDSNYAFPTSVDWHLLASVNRYSYSHQIANPSGSFNVCFLGDGDTNGSIG